MDALINCLANEVIWGHEL